VATNNSWEAEVSQALQDAIERANNAGIFIAAAGNSGTDNDATPSYPASYPNANVMQWPLSLLADCLVFLNMVLHL
jgi:subtilisin family serine protease